MENTDIQLSDILKNRCNWNLAGDAELLKHLESLSTKIIANANSTLHELESFENEMDEACVNFSTANNKFLALSDTQFLENKLKEESVETPNINLQQEEKLPEKDDISSKLKEALDNGFNLLNQQYEIIQITGSDSDSGDEGNINSEVLLKAHNTYTNRKLPYLIGSDNFVADEHVGLGSSSPEDQSEEDTSDEDESCSSESMDRMLLGSRSKDQGSAISDSASDNSDQNNDRFAENYVASPNMSNMSYAEQLASRISNYSSPDPPMMSQYISSTTIPPHVGDTFSPPPITDKYNMDYEEDVDENDSDSGKDLFESQYDQRNDNNVNKNRNSAKQSELESLKHQNSSSFNSIMSNTHSPEFAENVSDGKYLSAKPQSLKQSTEDLFDSIKISNPEPCRPNNLEKSFKDHLAATLSKPKLSHTAQENNLEKSSESDSNKSKPSQVVEKSSSQNLLFKEHLAAALSKPKPSFGAQKNNSQTSQNQNIEENFEKPLPPPLTDSVKINKSNPSHEEKNNFVNPSLDDLFDSGASQNQNPVSKIQTADILFSDEEDDLFKVIPRNQVKNPLPLSKKPEMTKPISSKQIKSIEKKFDLFDESDSDDDPFSISKNLNKTLLPKFLKNSDSKDEQKIDNYRIIDSNSTVEKIISSKSPGNVDNANSNEINGKNILLPKFLKNSDSKDERKIDNNGLIDTTLALAKEISLKPENFGNANSNKNLVNDLLESGNEKILELESETEKNLKSKNNDIRNQGGDESFDLFADEKEESKLSENHSNESVNGKIQENIFEKKNFDDEKNIVIPDLKESKINEDFLPPNRLFEDDDDDDEDLFTEKKFLRTKENPRIEKNEKSDFEKISDFKTMNFEPSFWDEVPPLPSSNHKEENSFLENKSNLLFEENSKNTNLEKEKNLIPEIIQNDVPNNSILEESTPKNALPDAGAFRNNTEQVAGDTLTSSLPKKQPGKLSIGKPLNINVNSLLPNTKWSDVKKELFPQQTTKSEYAEDKSNKNSLITGNSIPSTPQIAPEPIPTAVGLRKNSEILTSFTKERARISTKRRPPTRKNRIFTDNDGASDKLPESKPNNVEENLQDVPESIIPSKPVSKFSDSSKDVSENTAGSPPVSIAPSNSNLSNSVIPKTSEFADSGYSRIRRPIGNLPPLVITKESHYSKVIPNIPGVTSEKFENSTIVTAEISKKNDLVPKKLELTNDEMLKNPSEVSRTILRSSESKIISSSNESGRNSKISKKVETESDIFETVPPLPINSKKIEDQTKKLLIKTKQLDDLFNDDSNDEDDDLFKDIFKQKLKINNSSNSKIQKIVEESNSKTDLFESNVERENLPIDFQNAESIDLFPPDPIVSKHTAGFGGSRGILKFSNPATNQSNQISKPILSIPTDSKHYPESTPESQKLSSENLTRQSQKERDIFEEAKEYIKVLGEENSDDDDLFASKKVSSSELKKETVPESKLESKISVKQTDKKIIVEREKKNLFLDEENEKDNMFKFSGFGDKKGKFSKNKSLFGDEDDNDDDIFFGKVHKKTGAINKPSGESGSSDFVKKTDRIVKLKGKPATKDPLVPKSIFADDSDGEDIFK